MSKISLRLTFLVILLIAAFIYRFPVQIQKFVLDTKDSVRQFVTRRNTPPEADADTPAKNDKAKTDIIVITLKNKGEIKGTIVKETDDNIKVDIGIGVVGVAKSDIEKIEKASEGEKARILSEWEKAGGSAGMGGVSTTIRYHDKDRITVTVILNDNVKTRLILDTGAPYLAVTPEIGKKLVSLDKTISKSVDMKWTDGSNTEGKLVLLKSVKVGDIKVNNVEAVIAEIPILDPGTSGLLGMSFLKNFHIKIDAKGNSITLERR
ncbi:MAG: clan AA aspartic protease [Candidatus Omnitrophica bacterium]|nr:clan AA aspartic protease [Candidatus Omnitrophota bacterium]